MALAVKNPPADAGGVGPVPELGRSPGEGNGNPLQYSCLKNSMNRGAWQAAVHGVAKGQTQLSDRTHTHTQSPHTSVPYKNNFPHYQHPPPGGVQFS